MSLREQFAELSKQLAELRRDIGTAHQQVDVPEVRETLDELVPKFDAAVADMHKAFPTAMGEIERDLADCERQNAEIERDLEGLRAKLMEAAAATVPAAVTGLAAGYGALLRNEVLQRFGKREPATPIRKEDHLDSVAVAWPEPTESVVGDGASVVEPEPEKPAKAPVKEKKKTEKPTGDKNLWDGLSTVEEE